MPSPSAPATAPDHDALHHRLFADPRVVAQLLTGFVAGPWLDDLDLGAMERLNAKFHAGTGERREGDMIWRIPRRDGAPGGEDAYLVLLLEFQSTSERFMALRVLTYAALLWQQLIAERRIEPGGTLPPILPVVIYNGGPRWRAPLAVRELIRLAEDSPLWRWQPEVRYHLIDAGAFGEADLAARDGLPALWFRLQGAADLARAIEAEAAAFKWLRRHPGFEAARAVFVELLNATIVPRRSGVRMTEDLLEDQTMLATRAEEWIREWKQEGRREGRQEGEAALVARLLERRFGALPDWAAERVRTAEISALEEWGMRVLDATTLDEVFATRPV